MITSEQLAQKRNELSKIVGPIPPSKLPNWKIDYKGLVAYSEKHGKNPGELSDEEKVIFIADHK